LRSVAIVGGGLAGLAAAHRLATHGFQVTLFEAKRELGGRAGSFREEANDEIIDHCQHVAMGCCEEYLEFVEDVGCSDFFRKHHTLPFIGPDGRRHDLKAAAWLPPPLHLAPSLLKLSYLSFRERLQISRAMLKLARTGPADEVSSIEEWLLSKKQSPNAIRRFWAVVLVSALGESLDRASVAAAKKVFVDGFMKTRDGYALFIPTAPLKSIYDQIEKHLARRGVSIRKSTSVSKVVINEHAGEPQAELIELADGSTFACDAVVVAVPWRAIERLFAPVPKPLAAMLLWAAELRSAPITSVHLWFNRPIFESPQHAVLIDRLSQWIFRRKPASQPTQTGHHYYQVVISASRDLEGRSHEEIVGDVQQELASIWPAARSAALVRSRVLTQKNAVFSYRPGLDANRPSQSSGIDNLALAGDWTATAWPSTMESAVRSGNAAAELLVSSGKTH